MTHPRCGESLVALDMSKYEEIRRQTVNEDWTAGVVADATIDDLDTKAIAKAREGYKRRYPRLAKECDGWDDKVFLDKPIDPADVRIVLKLVNPSYLSGKHQFIKMQTGLFPPRRWAFHEFTSVSELMSFALL